MTYTLLGGALNYSIQIQSDEIDPDPVKNNTQIFLVVVGVVILFSSVQSATDHALFYK